MTSEAGENKLRPVIIAFNALIYIMFIILLVLYFVLPDPISKQSCVTDNVNPEFFTPKVIVAVAFKVCKFKPLHTHPLYLFLSYMLLF